MEKMVGYRTVYESGEAETVEKKSRFITNVYHVETEEEVQAYLEALHKQHWSANHVCYAYILGKKQELVRASDDGEPSGTAGRPILDVVQGAGLCNTLVTVTRYFGGTLLGTGGLVRAYSEGAKAGLAASVLVDKQPAQLLEITTDYVGIGKILYILGQEELTAIDSNYGENVILQVPVPETQLEHLKKQITEGTSGQAKMNELRALYLGTISGKVQVFED